MSSKKPPFEGEGSNSNAPKTLLMSKESSNAAAEGKMQDESVNIDPKDLREFFSEAIDNNDVDALELIIEQIIINEKNLDTFKVTRSNDDYKPLAWAVDNSNPQVVELLIRKGANPLGKTSARYIDIRDKTEKKFYELDYWELASRRAEKGDQQSVEVAQVVRDAIVDKYIKEKGDSAELRKEIKYKRDEEDDKDKIAIQKYNEGFSLQNLASNANVGGQVQTQTQPEQQTPAKKGTYVSRKKTVVQEAEPVEEPEQPKQSDENAKPQRYHQTRKTVETDQKQATEESKKADEAEKAKRYVVSKTAFIMEAFKQNENILEILRGRMYEAMTSNNANRVEELAKGINKGFYLLDNAINYLDFSTNAKGALVSYKRSYPLEANLTALEYAKKNKCNPEIITILEKYSKKVESKVDSKSKHKL